MTQDRRNRIAVVLAVVLVPTMVYLMVSNVREARRRSRAPTGSAEVPMPALSLEAAQANLSSAPTPATVDPTVLREQKKIADQRPKRSPFFLSPATSETVTTQPRTSRPEHKTATEFRLELNGILFGKTADSRAAIINGKMLSEGKSIAGYKVVTIDTSEVVLESGTNRITLRLKQ